MIVFCIAVYHVYVLSVKCSFRYFGVSKEYEQQIFFTSWYRFMYCVLKKKVKCESGTILILKVIQ